MKTNQMRRRKTFLIIIFTIGLLFGYPKAYYSIVNRKYDTEMKKLQETGKLNFNIIANIEQKTIEKGGNSIHYFVSGAKTGETIVFVHPAFGDHRCFNKQIDCFSHDFRVITIDMLGHGLTGTGKSGGDISETYIHIDSILAQEKIENAHIVGVSLGSLIAQYFALKYPEKVLSLTVLGGYNINKEQKEVIKAQQKEMFKWLFKMIFSMDAFRRYTSSVTLIDNVEQAHFYESAKLFTRKSFTVMTGLDKLIANRFVQRNYPLLILAGEKDTELAIKAAEQWHRDDPESQMQIIENAGHCANMDNSARFNEILMAFLTDKK